MIISQHTDVAGFIRIQWQSPNTSNIYNYKFRNEPTEQELEELSNASDEEDELRQIQQIDLSIHVEREVLLLFIHKIKETPNVTLAQYNTYLGTLHWSQAAVIKYFVFMIAQRLAERKDLNLINMNENTVLAAVRDFIVNTPIRKLARLIFNTNE